MGLRGQGGVRSWRNFWRWTTPDREDFLAENGALLLEKQISLSQGRSNPVRLFALGDLRDATSDFDIGRTLGIGSCYYLGILENRRVVIKAIKYSDDTRIREDLIAEIAILSNFHHRNIVKLVGCCLETKVPLLVYEYVPRGNLLDNLGLWRENGGAETPSWSTRLRIAMGVADALTYLHCSTSQAVVHRSVKPENVMLDDDYTAKLAGSHFLFPMPLDREREECYDVVAGTLGYIDPEYRLTGLITEKVDVYSFGQLLQDMLFGMVWSRRGSNRVYDPFSRILELENRLLNPLLLPLQQQQQQQSLSPKIVWGQPSLEKSPGEKSSFSSDADDGDQIYQDKEPAVDSECEDWIRDYVMLEVYLATKEEYLMMVAENASGPESSGGKTKQLRALSDLASLCCREHSEERPGMKEVASELRRINGMELP